MGSVKAQAEIAERRLRPVYGMNFFFVLYCLMAILAPSL